MARPTCISAGCLFLEALATAGLSNADLLSIYEPIYNPRFKQSAMAMYCNAATGPG